MFISPMLLGQIKEPVEEPFGPGIPFISEPKVSP